MSVSSSQVKLNIQAPASRINRWWPAWLGLILVVGAVFRLTALSLMEFRHDSAYWAMDAYRILQGEYWPLVGQQVGSVHVELYNGPVLSYISALVFAGLGYQPAAMAAFIALCNVAGLYFTFLLGKQLYSSAVGLLAALLMSISPWLVLYGRMFWPQALFPSLIPLSFLVLVLAIKKDKPILHLVYGVLLGIGLQLHLSIMALVGTGLLFELIYSRRRLLAAGWFGAGVVVGYSPVILYDITHNFVNLSGLLRLPALHAVNEPRIFHFAKALWNFENVLAGQGLWVSKLSDVAYLPAAIDWGQGFLFSVLFVLALVMLIAENFRGKNLKESLRFSHPEGLLLLFVILPLVYLVMSRSLIQRHYYLFFYPIPFLIIARGLLSWQSYLARRQASKIILLAAPLLLGIACLFNGITVMYGYNFLRSSGGEGQYGTVLADKQAAVDFILSQATGAYRVKIDGVQETLPYVFLFAARAKIAVDGPEAEARAIYSTIAAGTSPHQYEIVEPKYYVGPAINSSEILYQARGVIVLDKQ